MTLLDALTLGIVQGIAEFLPISSSGHLIIARDLLGIQTDHGLAVDAVLQLATVLAVIIYFRDDLVSIMRGLFRRVRGSDEGQGMMTLVSALIVGTIPAVAAGFLLEHHMETLFRNAHLVAWVLLAGSALFALAEYSAYRRTRSRIGIDPVPLTDTTADRYASISVMHGFVIGVFQTLALVPGMSRSGATISGGMLVGLPREQAARFAFLLSIPIILGSGAKKLIELGHTPLGPTEWHLIALATGVAFLTGLATIHYLLRFLRQHTLVPFIVYRVLLALCVLLYLA